MPLYTEQGARRAWTGQHRADCARILAPPPKLTVSEWADRYRVLSGEASAEPGQWRTARAPYLRGIMDAFADRRIQRVVFMKSSQVGGTEVINNVLGYYIHQDPAPVLVVQPTVDMGRAWSTDRLAPMLRDSPALRGAVRDPRSRDANNTILHKVFPGGHLTIVGANAPAGLASRPIRIVLFDEKDRYPKSAGTEGDPSALARQRQATFWNRKEADISTPTLKGLSAIEDDFGESDQRYYMVPCPHCGHMQRLMWANIKFESRNPDTAHYVCEECACLIDESRKNWMLSPTNGADWVATRPEVKGIAGFHISALYSPWTRWAEIVDEFLKARGNQQRMQVWTNTKLGETFEVAGDQIAPDSLAARAEQYAAEVPNGVGVLVASVDVQGDRLELKVKGWGRGEESWLIRHEQFWGDPGRPDVWAQLDAALLAPFAHESGAALGILACTIDSGGHHTDHVYKFVGARQHRRIIAIKGYGEEGRASLGRPSKANKYGVRLFPVGVTTIKDTIFSRMKITTPGVPGYMHYPLGLDAEYFAQLTAEKATTHMVKGRPHRGYEKTRPRNETLDLEVYNYAALLSLGVGTLRNLGNLADQLMPAKIESAPVDEPADEPAPVVSAVRPWLTRY